MQEKVLRAKQNEYEAVLVLRSYARNYDVGLWYGAEYSPPHWVVKQLEIRYKNQRVPLGRGAYCDLAEVSGIRFYRNQQREMVLVIKGGDAHDSYSAYLIFRRGELVRRRVESSEFPKNFYEETRYVNIPVRD